MSKIIIASGPVIVENNKVILNKHGEDNFWKFCGGKVENLSENLFKAAQREAKEEIGVDLELKETEPFLFYSQKKINEEVVDIILVHWFVRRIGEVRPGNDIRAVEWHDLSDLPEDLAPNILPTLKHFKFL
jgi:ADP-ribose pyrophosphatase YjhB (NUDIX family)